MKNSKLSLTVLGEKLVVCRLDKDVAIPDWLDKNYFFSITKTDDELSIVCAEKNVPENITIEKSWRALKIEGPLDFALIGILSSIATSLSEAGISIFAISTYDTDYILVKEEKLDEAVKVLSTFCSVQIET